MSSSEPFGQRGRLLAAVVLLVALCGLFVWYGTLSYVPAMNDYPDEDHVAPNPEPTSVTGSSSRGPSSRPTP